MTGAIVRACSLEKTLHQDFADTSWTQLWQICSRISIRQRSGKHYWIRPWDNEWESHQKTVPRSPANVIYIHQSSNKYELFHQDIQGEGCSSTWMQTSPLPDITQLDDVNIRSKQMAASSKHLVDDVGEMCNTLSLIHRRPTGQRPANRQSCKSRCHQTKQSHIRLL